MSFELPVEPRTNSQAFSEFAVSLLEQEEDGLELLRLARDVQRWMSERIEGDDKAPVTVTLNAALHRLVPEMGYDTLKQAAASIKDLLGSGCLLEEHRKPLQDLYLARRGELQGGDT